MNWSNSFYYKQSYSFLVSTCQVTDFLYVHLEYVICFPLVACEALVSCQIVNWGTIFFLSQLQQLFIWWDGNRTGATCFLTSWFSLYATPLLLIMAHYWADSWSERRFIAAAGFQRQIDLLYSVIWCKGHPRMWKLSSIWKLTLWVGISTTLLQYRVCIENSKCLMQLTFPFFSLTF